MKSIVQGLIMIGIVILMTGCGKGKSNEVKLGTIYKEEGISIYNSELVDTYLIACALYFDFKSDNLINEKSEIGKQVKNYFSPYKEHHFIEQMEWYTEKSYKNFNFNVLVPLTNYCYGEEQEKVPTDQLLSKVFLTEEAFQTFLDSLTQFYQDTNAKNFFASQQNYNQKIKETIEEEFSEKNLKVYIKAMEDYVGNKESYYPNQDVQYSILMSLYRPSGASFYPVYNENIVNFICFTAALEDRRDVDSFSLNMMVENAIHEYLHMYINPSVQQNETFIQLLSEGEEVTDYVGPMYQGLSWNRVVDENIVRAVQARIYAQILGNEKEAYEQILRKEIEWGGFQKVENLYNSLKEYEENRDQYTTIDGYIPALINVVLKK